MDHKAEGKDILTMAVAGSNELQVEDMAPKFMAELECVGPEGAKWRTKWKNTVVTQGKSDLINKYFGFASGAGYTAAWYLGLFNSAMTANTALTHALSLITSAEIGSYGANRPAITFGSALNSASQSVSQSASYVFNASTQSVGGAFICNVQATAGTNGILYSEGNFGATRVVQNADTLNVTVTVSFA